MNKHPILPITYYQLPSKVFIAAGLAVVLIGWITISYQAKKQPWPIL